MASDQDLRKRGGASSSKEAAAIPKNSQIQGKAKGSGVSVTDVLRILGGLFLLNCLLSYFITNDSVLWGYRPWFVRPGLVMRHLVGSTLPVQSPGIY